MKVQFPSSQPIPDLLEQGTAFSCPGKGTSRTINIIICLTAAQVPVMVPVKVALLGPDGAELPLRLQGQEGQELGTSTVLRCDKDTHDFVFTGTMGVNRVWDLGGWLPSRVARDCCRCSLLGTMCKWGCCALSGARRGGVGVCFGDGARIAGL